MATPSEVGLDLLPNKNGQKNINDVKKEMELSKQPKAETKKGVPGEGRPKNSKDGQKRKEKDFSPQTGASLIIWANKAQDDIAKVLHPILLDFYQKKNVRSLSSQEYDELDTIKTKILFTIDPYSKVNEDMVKSSMNKINNSKIHQTVSLYDRWRFNLQSEINAEMSVEEQKQAKAIFYSLVYSSVVHSTEK